ncbi:hypothetical protein Poli38472_007849 [Pythium oligandrum]|uniref:Cation-transporting ATPase n=1 Tax=Pythium oligandrum TaxID=41045 RepID=A0A8K1FQP9_PYTOL|nr:hypothetical protein Poli38472_007849 [Pythium oligandrum]|eukprot:TMW68177.1 hypothetical protein Poli38472_007849 [Pythium oligandrum]
MRAADAAAETASLVGNVSPRSGSPNGMSPPNGTGHPLLAGLVTTTPEFTNVLFFKKNSTRWMLYMLASVGSFGVLPLLCMWLPQLYTRLTKQQVTSIQQADVVLVKSETETLTSYDECPVHVLQDVSWFNYRKSRNFFDPKKQMFVKLQSELRENYGDIERRLKTGFTNIQAEGLQSIHGPNEIDLKPQPWQSVLLRKVLHPFYLFQVASALIWLSEAYTTYALIIMSMSALSIAWEIYSQVSSDRKLHELVHVDASVKVLRDNHFLSVAVHQLVVGDIIVVEEGLVPADLVLVAGECTADEATLTGEAIPITKQHLLHVTSDTRIDASIKVKAKECVLYAGSTLLAVKNDPPQCTRGIVLATGFSTAKGELFRSIVYPKPIHFRIERDSYRFLFTLSIVAILAFVKRLLQASKSDVVTTGDAIVSSLDLVTITVPPALPLILTVGVGFALKRLELANIFCINSQRVNLAGHIDCFCFDKTGTLSCDHLDFQGVDECSATSASFMGLQSEVDVLSINAIVGLATCHALNERHGEVTGYALEKDMFRATGYSLETNIHKRNTPNAPFSVLISSPIGKTFGVVKRYLFDASLQRSSVLIEDFESGQRVVYTKGSPEMIQTICNAASIPANYAEKVRQYSYQGYYVVALASKTYPVTADVPQREAMECRLNFLGFILFLNKIKTETPYVISALEDAGVDVRIITGDNALTAIHVARKINMELKSSVFLVDLDERTSNVAFVDVDDLATQPTPQWTALEAKTFLALAENNELALTGAALEKLQIQMSENSVFLEKLVLNTKIFARIRPHQKTWLVETLIRCGKCVGMVGDGTNDCGALKAAHVGIALSDADASIVAPFTSRQKLITDVVTLLREGRCALSTSFVAFKYMVLYSIIQLTMASLMNDYASQMSNNQFLFDDLVMVFGLSVLMVRTAAAEKLTRDIPAKTLFAPTIIVSLAGQIMLLFICIGIAISAAKTKDWYCSASHALELTKEHALNSSVVIEPPCYAFIPGEPADLTQHSYENSVLWLFGHLQYWIVAVAFNLQDSFRKVVYTNKPLVAYTFVLFIILQVQLFSYKSEQTIEKVGVDTSFGVLKLPAGFTTSLFFLFLFDLGCAIVWEVLVVGVVVTRIQLRQQTGSWGFKTTGKAKAHAYVADRDSLLGAKRSAKKAQDVKGAKKAGEVVPSASNNGARTDDDEDEEEDVLRRATEIV